MTNSLRRYAIAPLLVLLSLLGGCVYPLSIPSDLRVVSLQSRLKEKNVYVIDAVVRTNRNYAKFVRDDEYYTVVTGDFCDPPRERYSLFFSHIYDANHHLVTMDDSRKEFRSLDTSSRDIYFYNFEIDINPLPSYNNKYRDVLLPNEHFDLRMHVEDICLYFDAGGDDIAYRSNIIRIPKTDLEAILRTLPPP